LRSWLHGARCHAPCRGQRLGENNLSIVMTHSRARTRTRTYEVSPSGVRQRKKNPIRDSGIEDAATTKKHVAISRWRWKASRPKTLLKGPGRHPICRIQYRALTLCLSELEQLMDALSLSHLPYEKKPPHGFLLGVPSTHGYNCHILGSRSSCMATPQPAPTTLPGTRV
jgi:hypothetical protein